MSQRGFRRVETAKHLEPGDPKLGPGQRGSRRSFSPLRASSRRIVAPLVRTIPFVLNGATGRFPRNNLSLRTPLRKTAATSPFQAPCLSRNSSRPVLESDDQPQPRPSLVDRAYFVVYETGGKSDEPNHIFGNIGRDF